LSVPAQSYFSDGKGTDSLIGDIQTPDYMVSVDYGLYSPPISVPNTVQRQQIQTVVIDNRPATLVIYQDASKQQQAKNSWFIGVHFPKVHDSVVGAVKLTMHSWLQTEQQAQQVKVVFNSIHFDRQR
jgi:hypothetical protein